MKKFLHNFGFALLIAIIVMVGAIAAAPLFVRQEQVKAFIQKHVTLPDNDKLQLDEKVEFGFLPKIYFKTPIAKIVKENGNEMVYNNVYIGFFAHDLIRKNIKFEIGFTRDKLEFDGTIAVDDYNSLINNGASGVEIETKKPVPAKLTGNLAHNKETYTLKEFKLTHKDTTATGDLKLTNASEKSYRVDLKTNIETKNVDDIRRLIDFKKYDDKYDLFTGTGTINLDVNSTGKTLQDIENGVNGSGDISLKDAAIYGISLNSLMIKPKETDLNNANQREKINLDAANAKFDVKNSVLDISDFTAHNSFASVKGDGSVDVPQQTMDMNLDISAHTIGLSALMPLTVIGSFDNVRFIPRPDALLENGVKSTLNGGKVQLKNIKLDVTPDNINQLKDLGRSLGINMGKNKKKPATETNTNPQ